MNRMRENTGIVLWILVLSFGVLWVLQDSGVFDTMGLDPLGKVIIVDGDVITREEYNQRLEIQLEQIRQATNAAVEPERLEMERERVFDELVMNRLIQHQMDDLGITVSDREIQELITGNNPHPIVQANFSDESGQIDQALLQSVIDAPEYEATWLQIERIIRQDRRFQKFAEAMYTTVRVSDADIEELWLQEARTANADFFYLSYADVPDSAVALTDRDVERYYREHRDDYLRKRIYTVEIASLSKLPAAEDTIAILDEVGRMRSGFEAAENDSLYLADIGSEIPWSDAFLGPGTLEPELAEAIFGGDDPVQAGLIAGPVVAGQHAQIVKILEVRDSEDVGVRARHILIQAAQGNETEEAAARARIEEIRQRLEDGEDFEDLAFELSEDPSSKINRGNMGWFGPGRMVRAFQDAAFEAPIGQVVGPVQTQFGFHLIETTARANKEVRLARLGLSLEASVATLNALTEELEDLAYFGDETGDFVGEAERRGVDLQKMTIEEDQVSIPGLGASRSLAKFLEDAREEDISPIIELNDVAIIAHVSAIQPEGVRPLEEVETIVRPQALLDKKKDYQRERMTEAYESGGFGGLVQALAQQPRSVEQFSYADPIVPGLGRDLIFAGTVLGLDEGEDSGVVEGANAVFVVRTNTVNVPSSLDETQRETRLASLRSEREGQITDQWMGMLLEESDIEDLRTDLLPQQTP